MQFSEQLLLHFPGKEMLLHFPGNCSLECRTLSHGVGHGVKFSCFQNSSPGELCLSQQMEQCEGFSSRPHQISGQHSLHISIVSCKAVTGTALWPVLNHSLCLGPVLSASETSSGPYNCCHYTAELSTGWNSINQKAQHRSPADT